MEIHQRIIIVVVFLQWNKIGDTNYSRQIDKEDASFILNVALGINDSNNSSYLQLMLSDYNQDGVVNLQDSQEVLKKAISSN